MLTLISGMPSCLKDCCLGNLGIRRREGVLEDQHGIALLSVVPRLNATSDGETGVAARITVSLPFSRSITHLSSRSMNAVT